jgi:hypothetical protein
MIYFFQRHSVLPQLTVFYFNRCNLCSANNPSVKRNDGTVEILKKTFVAGKPITNEAALQFRKYKSKERGNEIRSSTTMHN